MFQLSSAQYAYLIFRHSLPKWHKTNATIRGILTALYTLKFSRDPLINRSLLCKHPRILQGDFQLYKYNIDVMEKIALSVKCSFHFTTYWRHFFDCLILFKSRSYLWLWLCMPVCNDPERLSMLIFRRLCMWICQ